MILYNKIIFLFSPSLSLNPYLLTNLNRLGYLPLKPFQLQACESIQNNNNIFVNSCTGSGKTLSYLLPIINQILYAQDNNEIPKEKGGLILTLNKELVYQIYKEVKKIDVENRINVKRIGSLTSNESTQDDEGISKIIKWSKTDILISTPQMLLNVLNMYKTVKVTEQLNPKFIAIDEADLLLQIDRNVQSYTSKIIKILQQSKEQKKIRKYLIACSSFPKKYNKKPSQSVLTQQFHPLSVIYGIDTHKLPKKIELYYVQIEATQEQAIKNEKLSYLYKTIEKNKDKTIIFCHDKNNIQTVATFLKDKMNIDAYQYYAEMNAALRASTIQKFDNGQMNILISSDLGSRGLDFASPVSTIIQYDMAENIVNFINRAGRAARNDLPGQIITFVEKKDKFLFDHIKQLRQANSQLDQLFSRKRSYRKMYKPQKDDLPKQN